MNTEQTPRIPVVIEASMTAEQRAVAEVVKSGPRGEVRGPFAVLLNSPGVFGPAQELGANLRFGSAIPARLRELAILVTAHHWRQDYEWRIHSVLARDAGVGDLTIEAIANGAALADASSEEAVIHAFCRQLHELNQVDEAAFSDAERLLGTAGVIDLCAICGYYAMLAMVMNVAKNPLPTTPSSFES
jgi:4-carboxymuconolactone decarboxylase